VLLQLRDGVIGDADIPSFDHFVATSALLLVCVFDLSHLCHSGQMWQMSSRGAFL
jgi:hypothetical protein